MFKKEIIITLMLLATFLTFSMSDLYTSGGLSLAEIDKVCSTSPDSAECKELSNSFSLSNMKTGIIYIILFLSTLAYVGFFATKVGVHHNKVGRESMFSKLAELLFEFDDSVEQMVLATNKPFAPAFINESEAHKFKLVPLNEDVKSTTKKFLYELKNINGQNTYVRVKSL